MRKVNQIHMFQILWHKTILFVWLNFFYFIAVKLELVLLHMNLFQIRKQKEIQTNDLNDKQCCSSRGKTGERERERENCSCCYSHTYILEVLSKLMNKWINTLTHTYDTHLLFINTIDLVRCISTKNVSETIESSLKDSLLNSK